jgi:histidinol-phosphate aminotransferase
MMLNRRKLTQLLGALPAAIPLGFATPRAEGAVEPTVIMGLDPSDMVRLDANENPAGPPQSAIDAITSGAKASARYHFEEFGAFSQALGVSEGIKPTEVLFGVGSGEIIDAALCAFTSATRPLITGVPTYDVPIAMARSLGRPVIEVPLLPDYGFPVHLLAEKAATAGGGMIYLCNPNNPTGTLSPNGDIHWLATNLPANTTLVVDEAYLDFADPAAAASAIRYVRESRDVVVTRTFSKIYGMAGMRVGFGCAKEELVRAMKPFRDNVVPILGLRAAMAALGEKATLIPLRRAAMSRSRTELCQWLHSNKIGFTESHANFVMIHLERDATAYRADLLRHNVAVGRPFPPLNRMLRVTLGTDEEMWRFREAFLPLYDI